MPRDGYGDGDSGSNPPWNKTRTITVCPAQTSLHPAPTTATHSTWSHRPSNWAPPTPQDWETTPSEWAIRKHSKKLTLCNGASRAVSDGQISSRRNHQRCGILDRSCIFFQGRGGTRASSPRQPASLAVPGDGPHARVARWPDMMLGWVLAYHGAYRRGQYRLGREVRLGL